MESENGFRATTLKSNFPNASTFKGLIKFNPFCYFTISLTQKIALVISSRVIKFIITTYNIETATAVQRTKHLYFRKEKVKKKNADYFIIQKK